MFKLRFFLQTPNISLITVCNFFTYFKIKDNLKINEIKYFTPLIKKQAIDIILHKVTFFHYLIAHLRPGDFDI